VFFSNLLLLGQLTPPSLVYLMVWVDESRVKGGVAVNLSVLVVTAKPPALFHHHNFVYIFSYLPTLTMYCCVQLLVSHNT
jgi:hypothetical protein